MKKTTGYRTTMDEARRIADEMRRTGEAVGYSWAIDTVRWLLRDALPEGKYVSSEGHNTPEAKYFFRDRWW
jgi:hypothetical protein